MELNESFPAEETQPVTAPTEPVADPTESVAETTEPVPVEPEQTATMPLEESENRTYEVMIVDVRRSFLETDFLDYTVSEGLLLLIFVVVLLQFFYNLVRR